MGYTVLPQYYDFLGEQPDYQKYARRVMEAYETYGAKESSLVLDLACGTGSLLLELLKSGADVIGTDLSPEMLSFARDKCEKEGYHPLLLLQDMRNLDLYGTVDVAVCSTNSLNYLENEKDLERVFALVHNFVTPGGLFMFDMNQLEKFEEIYADNSYVLETENVFCIWQNFYDKKSGSCRFDLTFFEEQEDGNYVRKDESQMQYFYSEKTVEALLSKTGFSLISKKTDDSRKDVHYLLRVNKPNSENK